MAPYYYYISHIYILTYSFFYKSFFSFILFGYSIPFLPSVTLEPPGGLLF